MSTVITPSAADAELAVQAVQAASRSEGYWAGVWKRLRRDPLDAERVDSDEKIERELQKLVAVKDHGSETHPAE